MFDICLFSFESFNLLHCVGGFFLGGVEGGGGGGGSMGFVEFEDFLVTEAMIWQ